MASSGLPSILNMLPRGIISWVLLLVLLTIVYTTASLIYNIFLHPLRSFPGPLSHRASILPKLSYMRRGQLPFHVSDLHARYGRVVRVAPNELAFLDPQAWRDIYTRKPKGNYELEKDRAFYNASGIEAYSVLSSPREKHDEIRKLLASGFSERSMRVQEPAIGAYVDTLIQRMTDLSTNADDQGKLRYVNMTDWLAYTTFDVIGMLAFGSDFGCLRKSDYHPWVRTVVGSIKDVSKLHQIKMMGLMPIASRLMKTFGVGIKLRRAFFEHTAVKTRERIALGAGQHDFLDGLIDSGMSFNEIRQNAALLVIAGSETTATLLAGAIYFLTTQPDILEKLKAEVRGRFENETDITLTSVNSLTYMLAVLDESLRCYPPFAVAAPRVVPKGGTEIAGHWIPQDAIVGIYHWAMYHSAEFFTEPHRFDPERFMRRQQKTDSDYAGDRLDVIHPFSIGPRNCIGRNLAYAEMRLILARLVWRFDMAIADDSRDWLEKQVIYTLWQKPALNIAFTPAR